MIAYNFSQKNYLVSGVTSGIGRQIVYDICNSGGFVLGLARNKSKLEAIKDMYINNFSFINIDLMNNNQILEYFDKFNFQKKIDGFVHSAGINKLTPFRSAKPETFNEMMNTNFFSAYYIIKLLLRNNLFKENSSIVFISSIAAIKSSKALSFYAASKGAVNSAAISLALELAPKKIRCNIVSPGWVRTDMSEKMESAYPGGLTSIENAHPLGIGSPEDVSALVLFLLSDSARWITGSNFVIDGGYNLT